MADTVIPSGGTRVGIVLENDTGSLTYSSTALNDAAYAGGLYDNTNKTLVQLTPATDISIDEFITSFEELSVLDDNYGRTVEIRKRGGGSCEVLAHNDSDTGSITDGTADAHNLIWAATNFPNGSGTSSATDITWNVLHDTNAGVKASDLTGYAIEVAHNIDGTNYFHWVFHNAKIKITPVISPESTLRLRLEWSDARVIEIISDTNAMGNHSDS